MLSSKDVALVASLSAVYAGYSYLSSNIVGSFTHGVDTFFVRSLLFVVLLFSTTKTGPAMLMGLISGALLEFTTPSPIHFYIFPSVLAYGLVFDAFVWMCRSPSRLKNNTVLAATILSSMTMSMVALSVFTYAQFFPFEALPMVWIFGVLRDVVVGSAGAVVGIEMSRTLFRV